MKSQGWGPDLKGLISSQEQEELAGGCAHRGRAMWGHSGRWPSVSQAEALLEIGPVSISSLGLLASKSVRMLISVVNSTIRSIMKFIIA